MIKFYQDNKTENLIAAVEDLDKEKYTLVKANTNEGAKEKHIPVYEIKGNEVFVRVGEKPHPMTEEHYITFIALIINNKINKVNLYPNDKPEAIFKYEKGAEIYAYCNKHSLWKTKIE